MALCVFRTGMMICSPPGGSSSSTARVTFNVKPSSSHLDNTSSPLNDSHVHFQASRKQQQLERVSTSAAGTLSANMLPPSRQQQQGSNFNNYFTDRSHIQRVGDGRKTKINTLIRKKQKRYHTHR